MNTAKLMDELKKRPQIELETAHHFSDNLYAKEMHLPKGNVAVSHKHHYAHLSILAAGVAQVETDLNKQIYRAPACINIEANVNHAITALEDVIWYCIHSTNEKYIEHIDEVLIKKE